MRRYVFVHSRDIRSQTERPLKQSPNRLQTLISRKCPFINKTHPKPTPAKTRPKGSRKSLCRERLRCVWSLPNPLRVLFLFVRLHSGSAIYAARGVAERNCGNCHSGCYRLRRLAMFFRKMRCGNWTSSRWLQSYCGGGSRGAEEERKHAETQIARVERRNLCQLVFMQRFPGKTLCGK